MKIPHSSSLKPSTFCQMETEDIIVWDSEILTDFLGANDIFRLLMHDQTAPGQAEQ